MEPKPFRRCPVCSQRWDSWQAFLLDPSLTVLGLQVAPKTPQANVLVFNHNRCGSISVLTSKLREVLDMSAPKAPEAEPCDGCYRDLSELAACNRPCTIAKDRRLTLLVLDVKRTGQLP